MRHNILNKLLFYARFLSVIVFIGLITHLLYQLKNHSIHFQNNLLSLLPESQNDPVFEDLSKEFSKQSAKQMVFVISNPNKDTALKASVYFTQELTKAWENASNLPIELSSPAYKNAFLSSSNFDNLYYQFYFPHRFALLTQDSMDILKRNDIDSFLQKITQKYYSAWIPLNKELLKLDPFLLFMDFSKTQQQHTSNFELSDGFVVKKVEDNYHVILTAKTTGNLLTFEQNHIIHQFLKFHKIEIERQFNRSQLRASGVFRFAYSMQKQMQDELKILGVVSFLMSILIILIVFKSLRYAFYTLLVSAIAALFSFAIVSIIYRDIYLITFVFGTSLLGVSVDYCFHWFCHANQKSTTLYEWPQRTLFLSITMGVITTLVGYCTFFATDYVALEQMAVFSICGIIGVYVIVILFFGSIKNPLKPTQLSFILTHPYKKYVDLMNRLFKHPIYLMIVLCIILITLIMGLSKLKFNDDISVLQTQSKPLIEESHFIQKKILEHIKPAFLLVLAHTNEELLIKLESISDFLNKMQNQQDLKQYQLISQFVPSQKRQLESINLIQNKLLNNSQFMVRFFKIYEPFQIHEKKILLKHNGSFLTLNDWLKSPISKPFSHLYLGSTKYGVASVVFMDELKNESLLGPILTTDLNSKTKVYFLDYPKMISQIFSQFRQNTSKMAIFFSILIVIILSLCYGIKTAFQIFLPAFLAILLTFSLLAIFKIDIHFIHIVAILLVLGIGVDYAIFLNQHSVHLKNTLLALCLSAFTTLSSFGLLALSQVVLLKSLGITVFLGVSLSFLLAPLSIVGFGNKIKH